MLKFSVMYPNKPGARFDHEYYLTKHIPMVEARMGKHLKKYTVDKGTGGAAPGDAAPFVVICSLFVESLDDFRSGFGAHAKEIMADIPNYTDISPTTQFSEVVVG